MLPRMLLSPTAGALIDRWNRRRVLQIADAGGFISIGLLTLIYFTGHLQLWQIYAAVALSGCCEAFQMPALSAAIPVLVRKDQLQRANGMLSTARSMSDIIGPALGGVLVAVGGLGTILSFDLGTFVIALATIQFAAIPIARHVAREKAGLRRPWAGSLDGLRYLFKLPSLRDLTILFFAVNLVMVFGFAVITPMVLARTGSDSASLADVVASLGAGGLAGGILLTIWGGPKRQIRAIVLGIVGTCVPAQLLLASARDVPAWCIFGFIGAAIIPIVNSAMQTVLQTKVPHDHLGRVFGATMFVAQIASPLATILAGPLADHVFEPQAASRTGLPNLLSPIVGHGKGSGMASMLFIAGVLGIVTALAGLASRPLRHLETLMPDADAASPPGKDNGQSGESAAKTQQDLSPSQPSEEPASA